MPPMAREMSDDGRVSTDLIEYYRKRAEDTGLVIVEHAYVSLEGKSSKKQLSMADDSVIDGFKELTDAIHNEKCFAIAQLNHARPQSIAYDKSNVNNMTKEDIEKVKDDFKNAYTDYSLALFQRFNLIRTEPLKFYSESDKYNLSNIIEELIDKNDKTLRLTWSTKKEKIINKIMQDNKITDIRKKLNAIKKFFSKDFDIKIYYAKGNFAKIDDALWNALYGLRNISEEKLRKFLTEKIDYCVIYSISEDDMKFDNEGENKENEEQNKDNQSNSSGAIISFFILFNNNLHSS